jgi:hypothetical protein
VRFTEHKDEEESRDAYNCLQKVRIETKGLRTPALQQKWREEEEIKGKPQIETIQEI